MKVCSKCKKEKSKDEFYQSSREPGGKMSWCKDCYREHYSRPDVRDRRQTWLEANRQKLRDIDHKSHANTKLSCLGHYSKSGIPICNVAGCSITDIDMLTIDHINNDGAAHKKSVGRSRIYSWIIRNGFPMGFQVLCMNHNLKKEIERKRLERR